MYVTCPLLRVPPGMFLQYEALVWAALDGLRPAEPLRKAADQVEVKLMEQAKAEVSASRTPASRAVQCGACSQSRAHPACSLCAALLCRPAPHATITCVCWVGSRGVFC